MDLPMDIAFGNAEQVPTEGTGWFISFGDWTREHRSGSTNLRFMERNALAHTIQSKWMQHPKGDDRGLAKPPSEGRTLSLLVSESGTFHLEFSTHGSFPSGLVVRHTLRNHGDFVIWGENLHHRWFVEDPCTILTFRWIPLPGSAAHPVLPSAIPFPARCFW